MLYSSVKKTALFAVFVSLGACGNPYLLNAASVAQEGTKATQKDRKTVFCHCAGFPGSAGPPRFFERRHFLRKPMGILIPPLFASPIIMPLGWVMGEGDSLEQAKKNAKENCEAALVKAGRQGEYVEMGGCYEGSFVASCKCKKTEPHKDPDKISLRTNSGSGSGYTEKEAVSKAKQDCVTSLSSGRTIYDKDKFKDSFKGWKTDCSLEVKNKQVLSSR